MEKYRKIDNVFMFDTKFKSIVGLNEPYNSLKNITWVGTEKIDGTNNRVYWDGYSIQIAGRNEKTTILQHLMDYLSSVFLTKEMEYVFEQMFGDK